MKKLISLLLSLLLASGTMFGCESNSPNEETNEVETTRNEVQETSPPSTAEPEKDTADGFFDCQQAFSTKGQKYTYQNNDVLILDVENTTDTHCSVLLTVTFYDEAGKAIRVQKKNYTLFPAKYQLYCLFQPNLQFASYTCEVSGEKYLGENDYLSTFLCGEYTDKVLRLENKASPSGNGERETLFVVNITPNFGPCTSLPAGKELWVQTDVVVFDNTGKLYAIVPQRHHYSNTEKIREGHSAVPILITPNIDMQIPEELKGELKIVQCISKYWVE